MNKVTTKEGVEYYQLWRSTAGLSTPESLYETLYPNPPPLPPRSAHKPLYRSLCQPPELPKKQNLKTPMRPEDCFGFEIVDVDEGPINMKVEKSKSFRIENNFFFPFTDENGCYEEHSAPKFAQITQSIVKTRGWNKQSNRMSPYANAPSKIITSTTNLSFYKINSNIRGSFTCM